MLSDILLSLVVKECLWRIPPPRLLARQINHKQSASVFAKWQALKTIVGYTYPSVFRRGLLSNPLWGSFCDRQQLPTLLPCHLRTFRASPVAAIFVSHSFTLCEDNSFLANEIRTGRIRNSWKDLLVQRFPIKRHAQWPSPKVYGKLRRVSTHFSSSGLAHQAS